MTNRVPLMPKATAVWLVDNTSLTFDQIAEFCNLHVLEVKGIADGDVAHGIKGMDPISSGQLTRDEIKRGQEEPGYRLKLSKSKVVIPEVKTKRGPRYTPVSRRQDRPNAILWLLRHHPELKDSQVMRLAGTTKPTIQAIRERTHWNSANLQPADPVTLGLCSQTDLDKEVQRAAKRVKREAAAAGGGEKAGTLQPTAETIGAGAVAGAEEIVASSTAAEIAEQQLAEEKSAMESLSSLSEEKPEEAEEEVPDAEAVFANIGESSEGGEDSDSGESVEEKSEG